MNEELKKSIDSLIEELFAESVEKSLDIAKDAKTKADEVVNQAPKMAKDVRPVREMHDVPQTDTDGVASKEYDKAITEEEKEEDQPEIRQVSDMSQVSEKSRIKTSSKALPVAPFKKSMELSEAEYLEFQELKKAQNQVRLEDLKKAEETKINDLIKSVVEKTAGKYESKIEELSKSLNEQKELVKAMARQPQRAKSVTNIEALEKSMESTSSKAENFTKSEMLDAAEELVKKGQMTVEQVIELENCGFIYNKDARQNLENYITKRK